MGTPFPVRRLAAGALLLYALVTLVLLPLHLLEAAPRGEAGAEGVALSAWCPGQDCHDPGHGHDEERHLHDPATCVACGQAAMPRVALDATSVGLPAPERVSASPSSDPPRAILPPRRLPPARGPPAHS